MNQQKKTYDPFDPAVRQRFLETWVDHEDPLEAAFSAFKGIDPSDAYAIAEELGKSKPLIRQREELRKHKLVGLDELPTRDEVALEAWERCRKSKNEEMAHKWMGIVSTILGYNTKAVDSHAANTTTVNKVMKVKESTTEDKWKQKLRRQQKKLREYKVGSKKTEGESPK